MSNFVRHTLCPFVASIIWGLSFVSQSICAGYLGPFSINAFRGLIAFLVLGAACIILRKRTDIGSAKDLLVSGAVCGGALFIAANLQQLGIETSTAGKAGFVTALYIVLVPISGGFFGKKAGKKVWLAVAVALVGMFFLCISSGDLSIGAGDLALLGCAVAFTVQIMCVDFMSSRVHPVALSASMFLFMSLFSLAGALIFERPAPSDFLPCMGSLLFIALLSSCVAYTLQIISQKGGNPAVVSLIMSLESVFAALGGAVILKEKLSQRELLGCILMAVAIVLAQLPERSSEEDTAVS